MLAAENQEKPAWETVIGSWAPPREVSMPMPIKSAAATASRAALISGITVTVVPSKLGSFWSLFLLCGAK